MRLIFLNELVKRVKSFIKQILKTYGTVYQIHAYFIFSI